MEHINALLISMKPLLEQYGYLALIVSIFLKVLAFPCLGNLDDRSVNSGLRTSHESEYGHGYILAQLLFRQYLWLLTWLLL